LIEGFMLLQKKIDEQHLTGADRPRHLNAAEPSEFVVPAFGAHDLEPSHNPTVWQAPLVTISVAGTDEPGNA
jgi:NADH-quinone oxidoreductase subunit B